MKTMHLTIKTQHGYHSTSTDNIQDIYAFIEKHAPIDVEIEGIGTFKGWEE